MIFVPPRFDLNFLKEEKAVPASSLEIEITAPSANGISLPTAGVVVLKVNLVNVSSRNIALRSIVGPKSITLKFASLSSNDRAPVMLVATTRTLAAPRQVLGTVQSNVRIPEASAGGGIRFALIGMLKVAPPSVERKRSKP